MAVSYGPKIIPEAVQFFASRSRSRRSLVEQGDSSRRHAALEHPYLPTATLFSSVQETVRRITSARLSLNAAATVSMVFAGMGVAFSNRAVLGQQGYGHYRTSAEVRLPDPQTAGDHLTSSERVGLSADRILT